MIVYIYVLNLALLNSKASRQSIPMEDVTQTYCLKLNRICLHAHCITKDTKYIYDMLNKLKEECCTYDIDVSVSITSGIHILLLKSKEVDLTLCLSLICKTLISQS